MSEIAGWGSFYAIVGSAAGALIGLQFVVIAVIAERPPARAADAGAAFATPTIVHLSAAPLLSAVLRAPWQAVTPVAALWGFMGIAGAAYSLIVARRIRVQNTYQPVFEDWLFHVLPPFVSYALLALSAVAAPTRTREALFAVGTASLLLLFIGIHNAWDSVSYHMLSNSDNTKVDRGESGGAGAPA